MRLIERLRGQKETERYSFSEYAQLLDTYSVGGNTYQITQSYVPGQKIEQAPHNLQGHAVSYSANPVVFACMAVRASVFSEARFQFQRLQAGRPGDLWGSSALSVLETPWPNGTTGELLTRMVNDVDLVGNFYAYREGSDLYRLRPDWVEIVLDRPAEEHNSRPVGYLYWPGGRQGGDVTHAVPFRLQDVVHWAPKPDPLCSYRGMSPLTALVREVQTDQQMTVHKESFLENGATPNMIVKADPAVSIENFLKFRETFQADHEGASNAYKTLFLGGAADVTVVGRDFQQLDFKQVQGAGETRIAAAFEVPPILVGLSEGLQAATYSNYASARRRFADGTLRPLWRSAAAALASVIPVPSDSRLWYDDRDISFLQEDAKDDADIAQTEASTIRTYLDAGFTAESVVDAVAAGDMSRLKHSGLFSVQLQPPGTQIDKPTTSQVVSSTN